MRIYLVLQQNFVFAAAACVLAGALSALAMAPFNIWGILFVTLCIFYMALATARTAWRGFALGWLFGFGYFVAGLWWIGNALLVEGNDFAWAWPLAVIGLPFILAFFFAVAGAGIHRLTAPYTWQGYFGFAAILTGCEWLRGHIFTGFPWNLFGYTWADVPPLLQIAFYLDAYGLTALTILWASLGGFIATAYANQRPWKTTVLLVMLSAFICLGVGAYRLQEPTQPDNTGYTIRIVQPNIAQAEKWDRDKIWDHFNHTLDLSRPPQSRPGKTIVVWPETAIGPWVLKDGFAMQEIAAMLNEFDPPATLITGALRHDEATGAYFNSIISISGDGSIGGIYNKHHLVPFGEYIPFQHIIPLKTVTQFSGFEAGPGPQTIEGAPGFFYNPAICYEIIFPGTVVDKSAPSLTNAIITVTNDAWYGDSPGPYQHFTAARFRAVEEGLPVIRAANTGISGVISPKGQILEQSSLLESFVGETQLPQFTGKKPWHRFFSGLMLITFVCMGCWLSLKKTLDL